MAIKYKSYQIKNMVLTPPRFCVGQKEWEQGKMPWKIKTKVYPKSKAVFKMAEIQNSVKKFS